LRPRFARDLAPSRCPPLSSGRPWAWLRPAH
jgi:hypothetical protein